MLTSWDVWTGQDQSQQFVLDTPRHIWMHSWKHIKSGGNTHPESTLEV
jgi:hypothetical protein